MVILWSKTANITGNITAGITGNITANTTASITANKSAAALFKYNSLYDAQVRTLPILNYK